MTSPSTSPAISCAHLEAVCPENEWVRDEDARACDSCGGPFVSSLLSSGISHCRLRGEPICRRCATRCLDLPGLRDALVCARCADGVIRLRTFRDNEAVYLVKNVGALAGSESFLLYRDDQPPYEADVWLSEDLTVLCFSRSGHGIGNGPGPVEGIPVYELDRVVEGVVTAELVGRKQTTSMCCCASENKDITRHESQFFSILCRDGSSLDLRATSRDSRNLWARRFKSALCLVPFVREYHLRGSLSLQRVLGHEEARSRLLQSSSNKAHARVQQYSERRARRQQTAKQIRNKYKLIDE